MESYRTITVELDVTGTLNITLNRPETANAVNGEVAAEIAAVLEPARRKRDVRAVVFRGAGPVFCGAIDVRWVEEMGRAERLVNINDAKTLAGMFDMVDAFPRPVLAAVHGTVVGDAMGLIAACDVVVASAETTFCLPHLRYGLMPSCAAPYLIAKTGGSHARNLMLTCRTVDAERAKDIRLIHEIVSAPADLDAAVAALVDDLRLASPEALKNCKKLIRRLTYHGHSLLTSDTLEDVALCLAENRASDEAKEGIAALRANRAPAWA